MQLTKGANSILNVRFDLMRCFLFVQNMAIIPYLFAKPYAATIVTEIMEYNVYLLATDPKNPCRDVIHSRDTGLKIRVYCLDTDKMVPDANEIQLFGYAHNKLYAFETIDITAEDALDVVGAIQWYAEYINYPEMEILPEDPRPGYNKEVAN